MEKAMPRKTEPEAGKVLLVSLGCDKNLVDSRQMAGILMAGGRYVFTDDESEARFAIVNTCCFIDSAKEESIEQILHLAELKKSGNLKFLIVAGCLAQRYKDEVRRLIPEVDAVIGTTAWDRLADVCDSLEKGKAPEGAVLDDPDRPAGYIAAEVPATPDSHIGYLKIAEGCSKFCTYCVIPRIRGRYRSIPMEQVLDEARRLAAAGARELVLVAQETTVYGTDLYGKKMLPELLRRLCLLDGIHWIRLLYCYPEEITDELISVVQREPKILHYFDIPIQHASDAVLKKMGRRTDRKELEDVIGRIRAAIPDVCLRTSLISGFPGETEADHRTLLRFVKKMRFDRLGVFIYSREEGTPAAAMKPQVHHATKKRRRKELMLLQQEIAFKAASKRKGEILEVLIDGKIAGEDVYVGRTYRDLPGVDSNIFVEAPYEIMTGTFVKVRVTGASGYDLTGEIIHESAE